MGTISFRHFEAADYESVCAFLRELNRKDHAHINWNWARWEWMYFHTEFDRSLISAIGLWTQGERVVGAAIYDQYFGEAFCGALPEFEALTPEIVDYALTHMKDENGLGIAVNDLDEAMKAVLLSRGFHAAEQDETMLRISLEAPLSYALPRPYAIQEVRLPEDLYPCQLVLWKGFDHGDDMAEFEASRACEAPKRPHMNPHLTISAVDARGNFAALCGCWYDPTTDYAYVEPVCTIPECRGQGLGRAVVYEALNRCRALGAKAAYVLSDQKFYRQLGFDFHSHHTFYWK